MTGCACGEGQIARSPNVGASSKAGDLRWPHLGAGEPGLSAHPEGGRRAAAMGPHSGGGRGGPRTSRARLVRGGFRTVARASSGRPGLPHGFPLSHVVPSATGYRRNGLASPRPAAEEGRTGAALPSPLSPSFPAPYLQAPRCLFSTTVKRAPSGSLPERPHVTLSPAPRRLLRRSSRRSSGWREWDGRGSPQELEPPLAVVTLRSRGGPWPERKTAGASGSLT
ncbi:uncharacterized protein LOC116420586 [Sarcophilus harrisii]|uniref:uncharacterized protein LOC116420586 n=1 Tax=Sarcophilus harrisii TaxID=9305 RepID=UPI001301C7EE|nr:uncharacterized protein LOC116420586 [Sarcophilus harrisii]